MVIPHKLRCEKCGDEAPIAVINTISEAGVATKWPISTMRDGALYVFIDCPNCGQIEQAIAPRGDAAQLLRPSR